MSNGLIYSSGGTCCGDEHLDGFHEGIAEVLGANEIAKGEILGSKRC